MPFRKCCRTIRIGGQLTKSQYQFTLQAPDTNELYQDAPKLEAKLRSDPQLQKLLQDVTSDLQITNPQVNVDIDRDKASALGVTANQVEDALYTAYGQRQISTIYAPNNAYRVITELEHQYQLDPSALSMLYVRSSSGQLVPLNAVAKLDAIAGPAHHQSPGPTAGSDHLLQSAPGRLARAMPSMPWARQRGKCCRQPSAPAFRARRRRFESSISGLGLLLVMAILVIYIVLGILYESFIHPLTILSGLPSAGFGALITLMLFHLELNLYAFRRRDHAGRHCEEKCHHDDRLGAGSSSATERKRRRRRSIREPCCASVPS